jgi:hypothetical protein
MRTRNGPSRPAGSRRPSPSRPFRTHAAVFSGRFIPTFDKLGDGTASAASLTTTTCKVSDGVVYYVGAGLCTLQASVTQGTNYLAATGAQQSFIIDRAPGSVSINNLPASATYGGNIKPTFDKLGDGTASVASMTTVTCKVSDGFVYYVGVGLCTLQALVTQGTNYLAATGARRL